MIRLLDDIRITGNYIGLKNYFGLSFWAVTKLKNLQKVELANSAAFQPEFRKKSTVTDFYRIGIRVRIPIRKAADFANDAHSNAGKVPRLLIFSNLNS